MNAIYIQIEKECRNVCFFSDEMQEKFLDAVGVGNIKDEIPFFPENFACCEPSLRILSKNKYRQNWIKRF
jgi:hypothetical protein